MTKRHLYLAFAALLALSTVPLAYADDDEDRGPAAVPADNPILEMQLVPIASLNTPAFVPGFPLGPFYPFNGSDLGTGHIRIFGNPSRRIEIRLLGVNQNGTPIPNAAYKVSFCRFGFPPSLTNSIPGGCIALGSLSLTDASGNAASPGDLKFPAAPSGTPDTWAGAFILTRDVLPVGATNEFISGFAFTPVVPQPQGGMPVDAEGTIAGPGGMSNSFLLNTNGVNMTVATNSSTDFKKLNDLNDVLSRVGQTVRVKGELMSTDGGKSFFVQASRVQLQGNPGNGHGGDDSDN